MNYKETLAYLFAQLPMYQRVGAAAYKADLSNTLSICHLLGNPEKDFLAVHIAGTNGKGSTANIIASILQEAGYKTALFTSPHLVDFRERIRVNGKKVNKEFVVDFVEKYSSGAAVIGASFFELTFGMAMKYFSAEKVDIAVVEVGMGGRLDSSNVVNPLVSVITNISKDHTAFLGNTMVAIAKEKAGIIKNDIPVVIGRHQQEIASTFHQVATQHNTNIYFADNFVSLGYSISNEVVSYTFLDSKTHTIDFPLKGVYQGENLKTALTALHFLALNESFSKAKNPSFIAAGLKHIYKNTHFLGRWQMLSDSPTTICDTGHNVDGLKQTMQQLLTYDFEKLRMVVGMVNDKDIDAALELMPKNAIYYFCKADIPRGLPADLLAKKALSYSLIGKSYNSVKEAFNYAKNEADVKDLIFIGGSTFVVAEVV